MSPKSVISKIIVALLLLLSLYYYYVVFKMDFTMMSNNITNSVMEIRYLLPPYNRYKDLVVLNGTCSDEAWQQGDHQRVVSYSFKKGKRGYWSGFNSILNAVSLRYPGWLVRIYATTSDIKFLKSKVTKSDILFYCDVNNLPSPLSNISDVHLAMWRYTPLGDPQIDVAIFRDSDSEILQREVDAVTEWLKSNKTFHIMRDHPKHKIYILGGTFGVKMNSSSRPKLWNLRDQMFDLGKGKTKKTTDQEMLMKVMWPVFENDQIAHDSYSCQYFNGTAPFPTRRHKESFVGEQIYRGIKYRRRPKCPVICRPKDHKDWKTC